MPTALECVEPIGKLVSFFRRNNLPVIFTEFVYSPHIPNATGKFYPVQLDYPQGGMRCCFEGDPSCNTIDELKPLPGELIITKHGYDAFYGTSLDYSLRCNDIKTIIITGVTTDICLFSTVCGGFHREYECIVLSDCTAADDPGTKEEVLKILDEAYAKVYTSGEVIKVLKEYLSS